MNTRVWISEIEFNNNSKIQFSENDITVFVGPNNAGKSASLKETADILRKKNHNDTVVGDFNINKKGDTSDLQNLLEAVSHKKFAGGPDPHYRGIDYDIVAPYIDQYWADCEKGLGPLFSLFVNTLSTEERL
jgi:predicted ATPase